MLPAESGLIKCVELLRSVEDYHKACPKIHEIKVGAAGAAGAAGALLPSLQRTQLDLSPLPLLVLAWLTSPPAPAPASAPAVQLDQ